MVEAEFNVKQASPQTLLRTFGAILSELRDRELVRSSNNPVADYAEHLVARALGLSLVRASTTGHDAVDAAGNRYEIKARRLTARNTSRQLSAIRGLDKEHFTHLIAVLFADDFRVYRAALVPRGVVCERAVFRTHVNAWVLHVPDAVWACAGVRDITSELRAAQADEPGVALPVMPAVPPGLPLTDAKAVPSSEPRVATGRARKQRDVMRELVKRLGLNREAVVAAYAACEQRGEVERLRNATGLDAEGYARALWADGVKKGWF